MSVGFGVGIQRLGSFGVATKAALLALPSPGANVKPTGFVYADSTPANNGIYIWTGAVWSRTRGLLEQMASLTVTGGTANAITATAQAGVDLSQIVVALLVPSLTNTGAVTLNGRAVSDAAGSALASGALAAGKVYMLWDDGTKYRAVFNTFVSIADVAGLTAALAAKADDATTTTALASKADATATTTALAGKVDKSGGTVAADPTVALGVATKQYVDNNLSSAVPAGAVAYFARNTAPTGYIKANGAAISRTTYAALFASIGTTFGVGDGSTTFNLPDLRGEFPRGWDDARGVDSGRAFGSAQASQNLAHTHTGSSSTDPGHSHSVLVGNGTTSANTTTALNTSALAGYTVTVGVTNTAGSHSHTLTINSDGGTEARPRNIALLACIKF